jgi:hypothetical protein
MHGGACGERIGNQLRSEVGAQQKQGPATPAAPGIASSRLTKPKQTKTYIPFYIYQAPRTYLHHSLHQLVRARITQLKSLNMSVYVITGVSRGIGVSLPHALVAHAHAYSSVV